ncbi:hypothetical protein FOZ62_002745, partial [Perkinsus olseni]
FIELFGASSLFFAAHIAIVCTFIANFDWHKQPAPKGDRKLAELLGRKRGRLGIAFEFKRFIMRPQPGALLLIMNCLSLSMAVRAPVDGITGKTLIPGQLLSFETAVPGDVIDYAIDAESLEVNGAYEVRTSMPGQAPMSTFFVLSATEARDPAVEVDDFKIVFRTDGNGTIIGAGEPDSTLRSAASWEI